MEYAKISEKYLCNIIDDMEAKTESPIKGFLVNYLRANIDDILELLKEAKDSLSTAPRTPAMPEGRGYMIPKVGAGQTAAILGSVQTPLKMKRAGSLPLAAYFGGCDIGIAVFDKIHDEEQGRFCTWGRNILPKDWEWFTRRGFDLVTVPGSGINSTEGNGSPVAEILFPEGKEAVVLALLQGRFVAEKEEEDLPGLYCANCGAVPELHHYKTRQCPVGGREAPAGQKQEWADTVYVQKTR
jgi:hypothetical protein